MKAPWSEGAGHYASLSLARRCAAAAVCLALALVLGYFSPYRVQFLSSLSMICLMVCCGGIGYVLFHESAAARKERLLAALFVIVVSAFFALVLGVAAVKGQPFGQS
jgi:hypothetical protein